jgi:allantoicase
VVLVRSLRCSVAVRDLVRLDPWIDGWATRRAVRRSGRGLDAAIVGTALTRMHIKRVDVDSVVSPKDSARLQDAG